MASGSKDNTIKLWNVKTGNLLQTLNGHSSPVCSVVYSPDGQTLASGSDDNTIKLWNVKTGKLLQTLTGHSNPVCSVVYSPDGQTLASGSDDNTIKIWQVAEFISKAPVQQTQFQVSQTNQSANLSKPTRRRFIKTRSFLIALLGLAIIIIGNSILQSNEEQPYGTESQPPKDNTSK